MERTPSSLRLISMTEPLRDEFARDWVMVDEEIEKRLADVTTWLQDHGSCETLIRPDEMGRVEQGYWFYGYLSALKDLRFRITGRRRQSH